MAKNYKYPPKFIQALQEKDAHLLLEERLAHFVEWLKTNRKVELLYWNESSYRLTDEQVQELIREYVDS